MKKEFITTAKIIIIGLIVGCGVSFVSAWNGPAGNPPTCPSGYTGCDAPVHVGAASQTKNGSLVTYGLGVINGGKLVFSNEAGERIQLWGGFTEGIQASTLYFRSQKNISFFKGGSHSNNEDDPGGGTKLLTLSGTDNKAYVNDVCLFAAPGTCLSSAGGGSAPTVGFTIASPISIGPTGYFEQNIAFPGANGNDAVVLIVPPSYGCGPFSAWVNSGNQVRVLFSNVHDGSSCTLPAGSYAVRLVR